MSVQGIYRLNYLVGRYFSELEYDLQAHLGVDLLTLYQSRQVRKLLNYIDRLPRNSYYAEAVANDVEHMALLTANQPGGDVAPRMSTWSPEVDMLARVVDAVRALNATLIVVNSKKGAKKPDVKPEPRPGTVSDEAKRHRKRKAHEALVGRVLPQQ